MQRPEWRALQTEQKQILSPGNAPKMIKNMEVSVAEVE